MDRATQDRLHQLLLGVEVVVEAPGLHVGERHLRRQRTYGAFWRALFRDAAAAGAIRADLDLSVARMLAMGALNWSVEWYREGRRTPSDVAAHAATMILDGLTPRPGKPGKARRRKRA